MYKNMLVHIPCSQSPQAVTDAAVSLARTADARLEAVAFGYEPITGQIAFDGNAAAIAAVLDIQRQEALERAQAALRIFEAAAKSAAINFQCRSLSASPADAADAMGQLSRLYELTIVSQPEPSHSLFDQMIPQSVLFNSGGPMLVIPYIHKGPFVADNVLICWNGTRESARAVRDAMPFLQQAKSVRILAVNEDEMDAGYATAQALASELGRLAVSARVEKRTETDVDVFNVILSHAADTNSRLLVMGGYGHSRFRETLLGGVTRGILETMTLSVLMSH